MKRQIRAIVSVFFWVIGIGMNSAWAFDHSYSLYRDSVLVPFVRDGKVDYVGLRNHRESLDGFIAQCGRVTFDEYQAFSREQKMAFLINLYNAATIQLVLNNWPLKSIRDLGGLFISPWTKKFILLFDRTIGLGQILHDILRPQFNDPHIHFALANASRGGSALPNEPFLPATLTEQLDDQAGQFMLRRPDCNHFEGGTLYLSPIFRWYQNDFGKRAGVLAFARKYFPDISESTPIEYTEYDWSLNSR